MFSGGSSFPEYDEILQRLPFRDQVVLYPLCVGVAHAHPANKAFFFGKFKVFGDNPVELGKCSLRAS